MKVNEKILEIIEQSELPLEEALLFCAAVELQQYGTLDWLVVTSDLIDAANEHKYRINLCIHDPETDTLALRYPLFTAAQPGASYTEFMKLLAAKGIRYNGHPNNPLKFSIVGAGDEDAFNAAVAGIGEVDIEKLASVTINYYCNTQYCKKLGDFLQSIAPAMYLSFEMGKTGLI